VLPALAVAGSLLAAGGCALFPSVAGSRPEPFAGRESSQPLPQDAWTRGVLECPEAGCTAWYAISLAEPGALRVEVRAPVGPAVPDFDVRLEGPDGDVLWGYAPTGHSPREIERMLGAGDYYLVLEEIGDVRGTLAYEVLASVTPSGPAFQLPAAPAARGPSAPRRHGPEAWVSAEIVQVEGEAGRPLVVVLDVGSVDRLRAGQRGELIDEGQVIATFVLEDVDERQSRGRLDAIPSETIRYETRARVRVPLP
jgi:hypothetical protein